MYSQIHFYLYVTSVYHNDFDAYYCFERDTRCRKRHKEIRKALKKGVVL